MKELFKNVYVIKSVGKNPTDMLLTIKPIDGEICYKERQIIVALPCDNRFENLMPGDLIRYIKGNKIELVSSMDYSDYQEKVKTLDLMSKDQIVELYNSFNDVIVLIYDEYFELSEIFIHDILDYNYRCRIVKGISDGIRDFINSKEVSDFFKEFIKRKIVNSRFSLHKILGSNKDFKDMIDEEFSIVYDRLKNVEMSKFESIDPSYTFFSYAMNLDSEGARVFFNREDMNMNVIKQIVNTSGLSDSPKYYSGRGVNRGDLNEHVLFEIYMKLRRIDVDKADNMAKMTIAMNNLSATHFLNNLYALARNNYDLRTTEKVELSYQGKNPDFERTITREMQEKFKFNVERIKRENQEPIDDGQILKRN